MDTPTYNTGPYDSDFDDPHFDEAFGIPTQDDRTWGMIVHLSGLVSILGPILVWFIKNGESEFLDDQGKEAINFHITVLIAAVASVILMFVLIGFVLIMIVGAAAFVLPIVAGVKANQGELYRYPFTLRLIK